MNWLSRGVSAFAVFIWGGASCLLCFSVPERGYAQSGDEVIEDPELAGSASSSSSGETVIDDPELAKSSGSSSNSSGFTSSSSGAAPQFVSDARLIWHSRLGMDLRYSDAREETWENTNIAVLEANIRRSESLRFAFGTRIRLYAGVLSRDVPDAKAQRVELDATPTAGYVDWTMATGVHLQVGYQSVHLGRFDIVSATDVLSISDTRNGPATLPEALDVGQLSVRLDVDASDWLSFKAIYIPFFTPYIISVSEGDYALLPLRQSEVSSDLNALGINDIAARQFSRAGREHLASSGLSAFAPDVGLAKQQGAMRVVAHGGFGELALTAASAIEKLPSVYFAPEAIAYIADQKTPEVAEAFEKADRPIYIAYNRFTLLSVDAAFDVDPVSIGFEAAYMFGRTLPTLGSGPYPGTLPLPDKSDVLQVGARVEYLKGSELFATVEAFGLYTLQLPHDPTRGWMFLEGGRYLAGAAVGAGWMPAETHLKFELGVLLMTGPTLVLSPRIGYSVIDSLELEVGALIIQGPAPPLAVTPRIAIGTLYDTVDQVFVGFVYSL